MKRWIFSFALLWIGIILPANAQFKGGIQAGMSLSDFKGGASTYFKSEGIIGITGEYNFNSHYLLQTALQFSFKGANGMVMSGYRQDPAVYIMDCNLYYLQLPILFGYRLPLVNHVNLVPSLGPYVACGVGGSANRNGISILGDGQSWNPFKKAIPYGKALDRFDWGIAFNIAIEVYKFDLSIGYQLGLYKNSFGIEDWNKFRNGSTLIMLGYKF